MRPASSLAFAALIVAGAPSLAAAQADACGVDCAQRAYTACNDAVDLTSGTSQSVSCAASLGSCSGETFCASLGHDLPAAAFPVAITRFTLLASDGNPMAAAMPFELQVYQERGTAAPGPPVGPRLDVSLAGSNTQASVVDLTQGGFQPIAVEAPGPFRVCLTKRFDAGHNVCLDANGTSASDRNWAYVSIAVDPSDPCGSQLGPPQWYRADGTMSPLPGFPGIEGDFILRATVEPSRFDAVPGADGCGGGEDAGASDGGTLRLDSGLGPAPDAGVLDQGGFVNDAGNAPGTGPRVDQVTPTRVQAGRPFELVILGGGFRPGLEAFVGREPLASIQLLGSSTLRGQITGLEEGLHDVLVINPDGQAGLLNEAVEASSGSSGSPPSASSCRCAGQGRDRRPVWGMLLGAGVALSRRRRRR